jgi:hypothetical protein
MHTGKGDERRVSATAVRQETLVLQLGWDAVALLYKEEPTEGLFSCP